MAREPFHDDSPTLMRMAVDYTDRLAKWPKRVAGVLWLLGILGALAFWIPTGVRVLKGFGPLSVQFFDHVEKSKQEHAALKETDAELDGHLHTILEQNGVVQEQQRAIIERLDTLSTEAKWRECIRERDRDIEAGRPARECRPFGGGP